MQLIFFTATNFFLFLGPHADRKPVTHFLGTGLTKYGSLSACLVAGCRQVNPNGIASASPGLPRAKRGYPGFTRHNVIQPQRGCVSWVVIYARKSHAIPRPPEHNPVGVGRGFCR